MWFIPYMSEKSSGIAEIIHTDSWIMETSSKTLIWYVGYQQLVFNWLGDESIGLHFD